jgi:hypothetical protein
MLVSILPIKGVSLNSFEELVEIYGKNQEYFTIDTYKFDHMICNFTKKNSSKSLNEIYMMCIDKLDILHKNIGRIYLDCGINIIVTSSLLMVVPIYSPYATTFGRNLYPDPLWYVGVISVPEIPKQWPETVGQLEIKTPFQLLEKSSKFNHE